MKLVSTTIAGPGAAATIGRAVASVLPLIDECIVLVNAPDADDRRATKDAVMTQALELQSKAELTFGEFDWQNDFSDARNRALDAAMKRGADWCLWVDTDEWIQWNTALDLARGSLHDQCRFAAGALMMSHVSGEYTQPRLIELPTVERWAGRTHECFPAFKVGQAPLSDFVFCDEQKTPDQLAAKFRRDEQILTEEVTRDALDARSWFYLGETKRNLGDVAGAIRAYDRRAMLKGWNEESAWACYRAAQCLAELEHYEPAIERCCTGLGLHAGVPELAWLAGWCNYKLGRWEQAIHWSQMAIIGGEYKGAVRVGDRIGFRYPPALYEAPFGVLQHAARELRKEGLMQLARDEFARALAAREKRGLT